MLRIISGKSVLGGALALILFVPPGAQAKGFEVIHAFQGGTDGSQPSADLIADAAGNLYGTTASAGGCEYCGTVFKIAPDGTEAVLHDFGAYNGDGEAPEDPVIMDTAGNLYGTTVGGGAAGFGTVFKIAPDGRETILSSFPGMFVANPHGALLLDKKGNLIGTTVAYFGTVFKLTPDGKFRTIHKFDGGNGGSNPFDGLISDRSGNLYGTASLGGTHGDYGTVFELSPRHVATLLYAFRGGADGCNPASRLLRDRSGNLYGTASGGTYDTQCNLGTVFKLAPDGTLSVLHSFGGNDGEVPESDVISDRKGNLYGTAFSGGSGSCGVVFRIASDGGHQVLHDFQNASDGCGPIGGLLLLKGTLYGTAAFGGQYGDGTMFEIKK
ncbi:MAG: choice-of-anchor tandem repeat GloVer-containing protein [Rhizomicrobium sp.]